MQKHLLNRTQREYLSRINKVIQYINENIGEDFSLERLAGVACFSQFHFHRIFSSFIGETPGDFVKRLRLEKAATLLLLDHTLNVSDIAYSTGFTSQAVFARAFKSRFGVSATEWRTGRHVASAKHANTGKDPITSDENPSAEDNYFAFVESYSSGDPVDSKFLKIEVKNLPPLEISYVAVLRGYKSESIRRAYEKLCGWAGQKGLLNENTLFIGIGWDDPEITDEDKCRYYTAISVPKNTVATGEICRMSLAGGNYAVARFEGVKEEITLAYKEMFAGWLPLNGYVPDDGPAYEIYYGNPDDNPGGIFMLDLCVPVKCVNV